MISHLDLQNNKVLTLIGNITAKKRGPIATLTNGAIGFNTTLLPGKDVNGRKTFWGTSLVFPFYKSELVQIAFDMNGSEILKRFRVIGPAAMIYADKDMMTAYITLPALGNISEMDLTTGMIKPVAQVCLPVPVK
jgi:hypothetical protein